MSEDKGLSTAAMHLAGHIFVGTAIFSIVAIAAFGLQTLVHFLETKGTSPNIIAALGYVDHFTFYLDIFCYVVMMVAAAYKFVRDVFRGI